MATLKEEVKTHIAAATTAILTGGVFDSNEIYGDDDTDGGGYDWASQNGLLESNGVSLKPHMIIRWSDSSAFQVESPKLSAEREFFEIYLYQNAGYSTIDAAKVAIKAVLHDKIYYPSDRELAHVQFTFFSKELKAQEYQHKPMKFIRFSVIGR